LVEPTNDRDGADGILAHPIAYTRQELPTCADMGVTVDPAAMKTPRSRRRLHPLAIRIMHWTNAVAMMVMITSGWGIYDDDVIIRGLHFGQLMRLGNWAAPSLQWHFAGMWVLGINGLAYLTYGLATGRLKERMLPIRVKEIVHTVIDTLHFRIAHEDLTTYNAVQKLLNIIVIGAGISQVITGLAIWKPVQFSQLVWLLGGFQAARFIHFTGMCVIVGFLAVHVALSLLVPSTLLAMLTGGSRFDGPKRGGRIAHAAVQGTPAIKEGTEL
jgi:thiosulfate reductase cytochrome b subunit